MGGRPPLSPVELIVLCNGGGRRSHAKCCFQQITMDEGIVPKQAGGLRGCSERGCVQQGWEVIQKPPRPFSVEKTGSCYILYIR